jgi:hypothetical protein
METWRHENMDIEHENMGIWKHENMETWRHGNANGDGGMAMKIWTWRYRLGHGDMNIDMKTWTWRHGHERLVSLLHKDRMELIQVPPRESQCGIPYMEFCQTSLLEFQGISKERK